MLKRNQMKKILKRISLSIWLIVWISGLLVIVLCVVIICWTLGRAHLIIGFVEMRWLSLIQAKRPASLFKCLQNLFWLSSPECPLLPFSAWEQKSFTNGNWIFLVLISTDPIVCRLYSFWFWVQYQASSNENELLVASWHGNDKQHKMFQFEFEGKLIYFSNSSMNQFYMP